MTTKAIAVAIAILALTLPTTASAYSAKLPDMRIEFDQLPAIAAPGVDFPELPARPHLDTSHIEEAATCAKEVQDCCEHTESTGNMPWNNDPVNCRFSCFIGAELQITVTSYDNQGVGKVDVWGHAECGGAYAECPRLPRTCTGASVGLATDPDENGECEGRTNDSFASDTQVVCLSTVKYICQISEASDINEWKECGFEFTCAGDEEAPGGAQICKHENTIFVCTYFMSCKAIPLPGTMANTVGLALANANGPVSSFAFASKEIAGSCNLKGCSIIHPVLPQDGP